MTTKKMEQFGKIAEITAYVFGCCVFFIYSCITIKNYSENKSKHNSLILESHTLTINVINDSLKCLVFDSLIFPLKNDSIPQLIYQIDSIRNQIESNIEIKKNKEMLEQKEKYLQEQIAILKKEFRPLYEIIKTQPIELSAGRKSLESLAHLVDSLTQKLNCYESSTR